MELFRNRTHHFTYDLLLVFVRHTVTSCCPVAKLAEFHSQAAHQLVFFLNIIVCRWTPNGALRTSCVKYSRRMRR